MADGCPLCSVYATCTHMNDSSVACICNSPYQGNGTYCWDGSPLSASGQAGVTGSVLGLVVLICVGLLLLAYRRKIDSNAKDGAAPPKDKTTMRRNSKKMAELNAQQCFSAPLLRKTESDLYRASRGPPRVRSSWSEAVSKSLAMQSSKSVPDGTTPNPSAHRYSISSNERTVAFMKDAPAPQNRFSQTGHGNPVHNVAFRSSLPVSMNKRQSVGSAVAEMCPALAMQHQNCLIHTMPIQGVYSAIPAGADVESLQSASEESTKTMGMPVQKIAPRPTTSTSNAKLRRLDSLEERATFSMQTDVLASRLHSKESGLSEEKSEHNLPELHSGSPQGPQRPSSLTLTLKKDPLGPCDSNTTVAMSLVLNDETSSEKDEALPISSECYSTQNLDSPTSPTTMQPNAAATGRKPSLHTSSDSSYIANREASTSSPDSPGESNNSTQVVQYDGCTLDSGFGAHCNVSERPLYKKRMARSLSPGRRGSGTDDDYSDNITAAKIVGRSSIPDQTFSMLSSLQDAGKLGAHTSLSGQTSPGSGSAFFLDALESIGIDNLEQELYNLRAQALHGNDDQGEPQQESEPQYLQRRSSGSLFTVKNANGRIKKCNSLGNMNAIVPTQPSTATTNDHANVRAVLSVPSTKQKLQKRLSKVSQHSIAALKGMMAD